MCVSAFPFVGVLGFPEIPLQAMILSAPFKTRVGEDSQGSQNPELVQYVGDKERGPRSLTAKVFKEMYSLWGRNTHMPRYNHGWNFQGMGSRQASDVKVLRAELWFVS